MRSRFTHALALGCALAACAFTTAAGTVALAGPATADPVIELDAPDSAPYWGTVLVTGNAAADATVQLFVKRTGDANFSPGQTATSEDNGNFAFTVRIVRTSDYYVTVGPDQSSTVETRVYTATCSIGAPLITHLPLGRGPAVDDLTSNFADFTASRGTTFAGTTGRKGELGVIVRRPGQPVKLLSAFRYSGDYSPAATGSVDVAGVTPQGAVVANVEPSSSAVAAGRYVSLLWRSGSVYELGHPKSWTSTRVTEISDDGYIAGVARVHVAGGAPVYRVAVWDNLGNLVFDRSTGTRPPSAVIDGDNDLGFTNSDGYAQALTISGHGHELRAYSLDVDRSQSQGIALTAASKNNVYAAVAPSPGDMQWTVPQTDDTDPIVGTAIDYPQQIFTANDRGDLLVGDVEPLSLHTVAGALVALPPAPRVQNDGRTDPGATVADTGVVAFTSVQDHLPHLLHCSTSM